MNTRSSSHLHDPLCATADRATAHAQSERVDGLTRTGWPGAATSPIMLALIATWFLLAAVVAVPLPGLHG